MSRMTFVNTLVRPSPPLHLIVIMSWHVLRASCQYVWADDKHLCWICVACILVRLGLRSASPRRPCGIVGRDRVPKAVAGRFERPAERPHRRPLLWQKLPPWRFRRPRRRPGKRKTTPRSTRGCRSALPWRSGQASALPPVRTRARRNGCGTRPLSWTCGGAKPRRGRQRGARTRLRAPSRRRQLLPRPQASRVPGPKPPLPRTTKNMMKIPDRFGAAWQQPERTYKASTASPLSARTGSSGTASADQ